MDVLLWNSTTGTQVPWPHLDFQPPLQYCQNYTFNITYVVPPEEVVLHFSNEAGDNIGFAFSHPAGGATLDGHVDLELRPATNVTVRLFQCDTTTEVDKVYGTTDADGNFTVSVSVSGTYDIGVKGETSLSNLVEDVDLSAAGRTDFGLLCEGEANGDDYISGGDYSLLSSAWMTWPGQVNWDARTDFTRDDFISGGDYSLLSYYWMDWGDCYGWSGDWD